MFQVLFDVLKLAIEQLLQSAKVEHSRRLPYKEAGFYSVYFVEHGVVVDGQFLERESKEVIGHTGVTQRVVVDDGVLFAQIISEHFIQQAYPQQIELRLQLFPLGH